MIEDRFKGIEFKLDLSECYFYLDMINKQQVMKCRICDKVIVDTNDTSMVKHIRYHTYNEIGGYLLQEGKLSKRFFGLVQGGFKDDN